MELVNILSQIEVFVYDNNLDNVSLTGITKLVANVIDFFSFGGYIAIGILLFSLILKIIPLPLDIYSRVATKKNSLRMERMRPELEKLQKQYANNKELYQKKMMALYKKEGYSTFAACLPTIFTLVFFIIVISAFNQYSSYSKVNVFNQMAISYSNSIRENLDVDGDGVNDLEIRYYDVYEEDIPEQNIKKGTLKETYQLINEITDEHDKKRVILYTVKSGDEAVAIEKKAIELAQDAAAEKYFELSKHQKFLWVKNIWIEDLPWKKAFVTEEIYNNTTFSYTKGCSCKATEITSDINKEGVYEILTGSPKLNEVKSQPNGYLILVVISIGSMFLSQIVMSKAQKAQLELQSVDQTAAQTNKMMKWMMPIMFGVFSFMYTASFSIYLIISTLFSMGSTVLINKIVENRFMKKVAKEEEEKYNKRYGHLTKNKNKDDK